MDTRLVRGAGLVCTLLYAFFIGWLYATQPASLPEVTGGVASALGAYRPNQERFETGLQFFRNDQFEEARSAFSQADPARQDPLVQFYTAYSYYRQGWGRSYSDDVLFAQGLDVLNRAIAMAPAGRIVVDDQNLGMRSGEELRAELQRGLEKDVSDFNPLRLLRQRK